MTWLKNTCFIFFGLLAVLLFSFSADAKVARRRTVSSIVIDASSGEVISASNADERRHPASLTKLMTLYITFDALEKGTLTFEDKLKVSRRAANREPSRLGLKPGETIAVKDAVLALIVKSANDCASVLAETLGGTEENFAKIMTKTAKDLGMTHTTFKNASGLTDPAQKTTARDMAILGSAVYHHFPEYYDLFSTTEFEYAGKKYYTHNHLLKRFKGTDGMKTGYTAAAGFNIITSAHHKDLRVIAVTMGHNSIKERDTKVAQMMTSGLTKLARSSSKSKKSLSDHLIAKLDVPSLADEPKEETSKIWAIQIGAFSNYIKARNYALEVQNGLQSFYANKTTVNVEPASKGSAVVYRSQLLGFEKNEADKTCYRLKKKNKSCIVVSSDVQQQLVMAKQ